jgi:hypothetical protein
MLTTPDARVMGMGGAFIGVADGIHNLFWNSAGLYSLQDVAFLGSVKANRFREQEWWSVSFGAPPSQSAGLYGSGYVKYDSESSGELHLFLLPVLFKTHETYYYGINVKYFDQKNGLPEREKGITLDVTLHTNRFSPLFIGVRCSNLSEPPVPLLPKRYDIGLSVRNAHWLVVADILGAEWDNYDDVRGRFGMEMYTGGLVFRCGYFDDEITGHGNLTFGLGTTTQARCILDYAYVRDREDSKNNMHLFSIRVRG